MKRFCAVLLVIAVLVSCADLGRELFERILKNNDFFKILLTFPGLSGGSYSERLRPLDDATVPVDASRRMGTGEVSYTVTPSGSIREVNLMPTWQCTLQVVYSDTADTLVRDTVNKPTPKVNASMRWQFEVNGETGTLLALSHGVGQTDSAVGHIQIDSVELILHRGGEVIPWLLLRTGSGLLPKDTFIFDTGDSFDVRLWSTADRATIWAFARSDDQASGGGFDYDAASGSFTATWTPSIAGNHFLWFEVIDMQDAFYDRNGADRAVFWAIPYRLR